MLAFELSLPWRLVVAFWRCLVFLVSDRPRASEGGSSQNRFWTRGTGTCLRICNDKNIVLVVILHGNQTGKQNWPKVLDKCRSYQHYQTMWFFLHQRHHHRQILPVFCTSYFIEPPCKPYCGQFSVNNVDHWVLLAHCASASLVSVARVQSAKVPCLSLLPHWHCTPLLLYPGGWLRLFLGLRKKQVSWVSARPPSAWSQAWFQKKAPSWCNPGKAVLPGLSVVSQRWYNHLILCWWRKSPDTRMSPPVNTG